MSRLQLNGEPVLFQMTSDQFCRLPESDQFDLQLINGDVVVLPRATPPHQYFLCGLIAVLRGWVESHQLGRILTEVLMKLDGRWTPAADIIFVKTEHLRRVTQKRIEGPVDLAVEILSPSTKQLDRRTKFAAYARFGIPWYWIVDLKKRVLEEYELAGKQYGEVVHASFDKRFRPRLFPRLTIDLASLEW